GSLLTVAVFLVYAWRVGQQLSQVCGLALATLIIGYQILALVERAASAQGPGALLPRAIWPWLVWSAAAVSLPILMYLPTTAALMGISPLAPGDWLVAL